MKKIIYIFVIIAFLPGCEEDFLNRKPLDKISSEAVFSDPALLEAYLYQNYNFIPHGYEFLSYSKNPDTPDPGTEQVGYNDQGAYMTDCLSDVLTNKSGWPTSNSVIIPGHMSSSTWLVGLDTWERDYKAIRISNLIIENLKTSDIDQEIVDRISGEARFIRAFMYFDLARRFGGVPLITKSLGIDDMDSVLVAKEPLENLYAFIDDELTDAANFLPSAKVLPAEELGRATQEACWALNGRAQLFAENWTRSAEMSKLVIESGSYVLSTDYNALFQSYGGDQEVIFEILFNGAEKGHSLDRMAYPFSHRTDWGSQFLPTQEMVESYEMTNGLKINDAGSGFDPNNPFVNRDSRLKASVLYHRNTFKGDTFLVALSSDNSILTDDIDAPNLTGNHTTTGYYLKKFLDESLPFGPEFGVSLTSWKEIRFAEVLLNYAEAQNEAAGPDATVYDAINQVRERADQPDLPSGLSKEEMFDRIVNERKVELFAEGFRYWDLRRWKMAIEVLNGKKAHGLFITKDANNPDNLTYEVVEAINRPSYVFLERNYLLPIPQGEIDKNPKLIQNPGY